MPIGVILARYLKVFDGLGPIWFHLHRSCQSLAFLIGIAGFGTVGYTTIVLAIWDVLKGFDILDAHNIWNKTYVGIIISLAIIAVILEVITWIWVCNKKMVKKSEEHVDIGQQRA
ncbi:Cytochrome b561 and DOMON domain-containing protein [Spatholobus suberectus]|nr:Cytochrome b561 and DOMON domain-containing protein [Spatholobus suberectus]